jgi:hypothetical protein
MDPQATANPMDFAFGVLILSTLVFAVSECPRLARTSAWITLALATLLPGLPGSFGIYALRAALFFGAFVSFIDLFDCWERLGLWWRTKLLREADNHEDSAHTTESHADVDGGKA